jgi:putative peptide zinc metalloprotease protein
VTVIAVFFAWLLLPWQGEIRVPGVLTPAQEQNFYAPMAGRIAENPTAMKNTVQAGEVLLNLQSPDLEHRTDLARITAATWSSQLEQQAFNEQLSGRGDVLKHQFAEATAQLTGLREEQARLTLRASFDGEVVFRADDLEPGTWIASRERLLAVVNRSTAVVDAFVGDSDLDRLHIGAPARFIPDATEFGRRSCRIADIERVNLSVIDDAGLASVHGGPLPSRQDRQGVALPASPVYRIRLERCDPAPAPALRLRGVVHLDADGRSILVGAMTNILAILIRESGF